MVIQKKFMLANFRNAGTIHISGWLLVHISSIQLMNYINSSATLISCDCKYIYNYENGCTVPLHYFCSKYDVPIFWTLLSEYSEKNKIPQPIDILYYVLADWENVCFLWKLMDAMNKIYFSMDFYLQVGNYFSELSIKETNW